MKVTPRRPPREFPVGTRPQITLKDCGSIQLEEDEQITFLTDKKSEYDIVRKDWGFYATPSLNGRLPSFSIKPLLVKSLDSGRYFILLLEKGKDSSFEEYCKKENIIVLAELDDQDHLSKIEETLKQSDTSP
jgi:hypothetical protein